MLCMHLHMYICIYLSAACCSFSMMMTEELATFPMPWRLFVYLHLIITIKYFHYIQHHQVQKGRALCSVPIMCRSEEWDK